MALYPYTAVMIAEGVEEATPEQQLEAWQTLEDTGLGYKLQGWFGRRLVELKAAGLVKPADRKEDDHDA